MAQYSVDIVARALGGSQVDQLAKSFQGVEQAAVKSQKGIDGAANNIRSIKPAAQSAATGMQGLGAAIQAALGPLLAVSTALGVLKKGLDTAFERGAAEQKLKNFTDSAGEYSAALAVAADSANKFGMSQTEATTALADVYSRLKGLGFGLKETSEIYQGFNAIAMQSGTTAEDASGAFLQLSQALGSGKLQGDELRAILERMPTLAQAIAQSMGVSAAEIRNMGQEGKISSEVIYKALSQAAAEADNFGNKLNAQQQAMKSLSQVADQLLNSIGQVFAPFVIAGAEALAAVGQKLADWWGYLGNVIFPAVMKALEPLRAALANAFADIDFSVIIDVVQNVLIKGMQMAIGVIGNVATALAAVVNWFKELSNNAIIQGLVGAMGAIVEKLGLAGSKVKDWKQEQEKVTDEAASSLDNYSSMPAPIEDAKEKAKELKKAQEGITEAIKQAVAEADKQAQSMTTAVNEQLSLTEARLKAETAINDVLLQQAERQLETATNEKGRVDAAKKIHYITIRNAELELRATNAAIEAETRKAQIALESARIKAKEVESVVLLAKAQGAVTEAHAEALAAQREAVGLAERHLQTTTAVAAEQYKAAQAVYEGKVAAADAAYQQNIVAKNTQTAATAAGEFAGNMERAAAAAKKAAASISAVQGMSTAKAVGVGYDFGAAGNNQAFKAAYETALAKLQQDLAKTFVSVDESQRRLNELNKKFFDAASEYNRRYWQENNKNMMESWRKGGGAPLPAYASGGYVSGPQVAMVGEGGEPEYIIPKSRMDDALANYAAGKRGNAVLGAPSQINLTYSGNIIRQDQGDYLSTSAVPGIVRQAVDQTISTLGRNPGARRNAGIS